MDLDHKVGDVLQIACPFIDARVADLSPDYVVVEWPGATCQVGIPPTIVHVISVDHFDPPLETGWLPRPHTLTTVLPAGQSHAPDLEDQGMSLDPHDDIPISFKLLFRPYDFLQADDEVADAAGGAWRFAGPFDWQPFDGGHPHEPAWPLTLLTREGSTRR
ncbi:hypothetical protein [Actinomadura rudentiformis]|uniref:hypothetical protein n=1 Tax=Actinomadura rudentiformis TaxID=359158 RepID=UPI001CEFA280|nr:hypothetical protein [Actinomadura rudentiformis]